MNGGAVVEGRGFDAGLEEGSVDDWFESEGGFRCVEEFEGF